MYCGSILTSANIQRSAPVSEMDKSHAEGGGRTDAGVDAGAELGYQGWAARRLVFGCHRIFVEHGGGGGGDATHLQQDPVKNKDLVSESLEHRGMIYWCLANINADVAASSTCAAAAAPSEADLRDEDVFHDGLTDFYHVWTLAEAFLLDSAPLPAAPLLRWLKMYSHSGEDEAARWELDEAERVALEADAAGGSADPTPAYWNALRSLVVGVTPRRAAEMLRSHPEGRDNTGEVGALARQLDKMPLLLPEGADGGGAAGAGAGGGAHLDREGFFETWTRWQKGCKAAAARFGVVVGAGVDRGSDIGGGGGEERRQLRWLWGTLCGERSCLEAGTKSWSGLFAAVLAFERPDTRKEEVAPVMRECLRKYSEHQEESFLTRVRGGNVGLSAVHTRAFCKQAKIFCMIHAWTLLSLANVRRKRRLIFVFFFLEVVSLLNQIGYVHSLARWSQMPSLQCVLKSVTIVVMKISPHQVFETKTFCPCIV